MQKKVENKQQEPPTVKDNPSPGSDQEETSGAKPPGEQQNPLPKPPEDDVATPKQDDPLLGKVGQAIQESSAAAESSAQEVVIHACTCGLLLAFGKGIAGHGGFHGWCDAQKFTFSRMSRCKYMRLADQLCQKGKSKSDLLLAVERGPDGRPSGFAIAEDKLKELVRKVCNNRSLTELYLDWGIEKKSKKSQPAAQVRSQAAFNRWVQSLEHAAPLIKSLPEQQRSEVIAKLDALLRTLKSESNQTGQ
ncbi:MAG: hypothetical protein ABSG78_25160 [Verrucomicrobiota bacterium]|jgi:hypothetical protein